MTDPSVGSSRRAEDVQDDDEEDRPGILLAPFDDRFRVPLVGQDKYMAKFVVARSEAKDRSTLA
jgi:hypothetical protein